MSEDELVVHFSGRSKRAPMSSYVQQIKQPSLLP